MLTFKRDKWGFEFYFIRIELAMYVFRAEFTMDFIITYPLREKMRDRSVAVLKNEPYWLFGFRTIPVTRIQTLYFSIESDLIEYGHNTRRTLVFNYFWTVFSQSEKINIHCPFVWRLILEINKLSGVVFAELKCSSVYTYPLPTGWSRLQQQQRHVGKSND